MSFIVTKLHYYFLLSRYLFHIDDFLCFLFFCILGSMGYFLANILVYGFLFALVVMGYTAIREMKKKK